ncbi:MAG: UDP-3-O-acyl-N-acetylglucosamine deacetylase [Oscillatoriales cyanobacterium RM2_1_1]|nr:UDP-3-O-acyl-N-acetylglucosamine deacetylase [Oscillatoriales cyanobacterium SM2_3_0]NJO47637.1 UDP-3-O-acyl-N-acetylglucosamine deacetylase [Oscillatoriales cyanobacterium RM2_1_1]
MALRSQFTLAQPFTLTGVGLHTGLLTEVRVMPGEWNRGRYFVRVDLPESPMIPASIQSVASTTLSTELVQQDSSLETKPSIRTVEHLLAALMGMGVDQARIEINGPEVPLLDGSAQEWVGAISAAGLVPVQSGSNLQDSALDLGLNLDPDLDPNFPISHPLAVQHRDAFVAAFPAAELRFTYGIDFSNSAIGNQWYSWSPQQANFAECLAPARTFVLEAQVKQLQQMGLIKGGSLENALVCGELGWLNPPLRFPEEPVRHKLLDLIGDLSLLGTIPNAHYVAYKAGHQLHTQLAQQIQNLRAE